MNMCDIHQLEAFKEKCNIIRELAWHYSSTKYYIYTYRHELCVAQPPSKYIWEHNAPHPTIFLRHIHTTTKTVYSSTNVMTKKYLYIPYGFPLVLFIWNHHEYVWWNNQCPPCGCWDCWSCVRRWTLASSFSFRPIYRNMNIFTKLSEWTR